MHSVAKSYGGPWKKRECRGEVPSFPELREDLLVRGRDYIRDEGSLRRGRKDRRLPQVHILRNRQAFMPQLGTPIQI